jgi:hypothetical protein
MVEASAIELQSAVQLNCRLRRRGSHFRSTITCNRHQARKTVTKHHWYDIPFPADLSDERDGAKDNCKPIRNPVAEKIT